MQRLFEPRAERIVNPGWSHGRFADAWSIIHILTGTLLGLLAFAFGIPPVRAFLFAAGAAALYEGLEIILRISEDAENVLTDIILTSASVPLAMYLTGEIVIVRAHVILVFVCVGLLELFLLSFGWKHYLKKKFFAEEY